MTKKQKRYTDEERLAHKLIKNGVTIQDYDESVQIPRIKRMKLWKEKGIKVLIDGEQKLIDSGIKVIARMKEVGDNNGRIFLRKPL